METKLRYIKFALTAVSLVVAQIAWAQSSVQLYGVIDEGLNFANNAQTGIPGGRTGRQLYSMTSSTNRGDRWGLRGTEDLGGGYKTLFVLESGFDTGTGAFQQGGTFFGRQAFIGISSPYGTITAGRQYDSIVDFVQLVSAAPGNGVYALHGNDMDDFGNTWHVNNAIKYVTPDYNGFKAGGLFSFGGVPGSFGTNSVFSFGASYATGPVTIAAAFLKVKDPNRSYWGSNSGSSTTANNLGAVTGVQFNPVFGGYASASSLQVAAAGIQYSFSGGLIAGLDYSHVGFHDLNDPASGNLNLTNPFDYHGSTSFNSYSAFARYAITSALWLNGSYSYLVGGGLDGKESARYQTFNAAIDYNFSARTTVYFMAGYQVASGVDSTGQKAVADFYLFIPPSNDSRQTVLRIGITHLF